MLVANLAALALVHMPTLAALILQEQPGGLGPDFALETNQKKKKNWGGGFFLAKISGGFPGENSFFCFFQ